MIQWHLEMDVMQVRGGKWKGLVPMGPLSTVPQASVSFPLFELLYRRQPRGLLDVLREDWETPAPMEEAYMEAMQKKLWTMMKFAQTKLWKAQDEQWRRYDAHVTS